LVVDEGSEPPVVVTEPGTQAGTGTHTWATPPTPLGLRYLSHAASLRLHASWVGLRKQRHGGDCLLCFLPAPAEASPCRRRRRACMGLSWTVPFPPAMTYTYIPS
jgi:hypothetical protein